jgi:hypothetical protein
MRVQVGRQLLDRQILDRAGLLVGKVDDLEFGTAPDGSVHVAALLTGQAALGQRVGGRLGRFLVAVAQRFADRSVVVPLRIPYELVDRVDSAVRLRVPLDRLPPAPVEEYLRTRLIDRIPGAHRAGG